jgi:hypothetical protein
MIGVSGSPGRDHSDQVACDDRIGIGPTGASLGLSPERIDAARPHVADPATDTQLPEPALRLLGLPAVPSGFESFFCGVLQHL